MPENSLQWIESDGVRVAASVDVQVTGEHDLYYPYTALIHITRGQINILRGSRMDTYKAGDFLLVRKFTMGKYFKTWSGTEGSFRMLGFLFQDEFLKELVDHFPPTVAGLHEVPAVSVLPSTSALNGLMASLAGYFQDGRTVERSIIRLKTLEAILTVVGADARMAPIFKAYAQPLRADLTQFMEKFITEKMTLEQLALTSGRSLSSFTREFRALFNTSPHQWIKQKRLEKARDLILREGRSPSEVYLQVGFEDLAHFSRSFKQQFGRNPSEMRRAVA